MKVRFIKSVACSVLGKIFVIDDIDEIDDERANDFIKSGIAIEIKEEKPRKAKKTQS